MTRFFKHSIFFLFIVYCPYNLFSFEKTVNKPIKYLTHKNIVNALLIKFDSITSSSYLKIGKTMNENAVHICFNDNIKVVDKLVPLVPDSIKAVSQELGIDNVKLNEIISLISQTKINSIKAVTVDNIKRVELFLSYNWFSENGKGLVYFPEQHKKSTLKIERFIHLDRHISY